MGFALLPSVLEAAQRHAREAYPNEACGLAVGDAYWACENEAADPTQTFEIHDAVMARAEATGALKAVIHSHPEGPFCPSAADMEAQAALDLPYVIIPVTHDAVTGTNEAHEPIVFGDCLGMAPLIGRRFVHGVHDCYATIRDAFRKGREVLAGEGVDWPHPPIDLPDFPRDAAWWQSEQDLYRANFAAAGFREIPARDARPGDVFLAVTPGSENPHKRMNHGGVLLPDDLLLHHLPNRLSRREAAGNWLRAIHLWLRHESVLDA